MTYLEKNEKLMEAGYYDYQFFYDLEDLLCHNFGGDVYRAVMAAVYGYVAFGSDIVYILDDCGNIDSLTINELKEGIDELYEDVFGEEE